MKTRLCDQVCILEPDVATIISKGDGLTLTTHAKQEAKAKEVAAAVQDLRSTWQQLKAQSEVASSAKLISY